MITQSSQGSGSRVTVVVVVVALFAAMAGAWLGWQRSARPALEAAVLYPEPRQITPFALTGDGQPFDQEDLAQGWDLLFFGFTHCPDVCPATLSMLRDVNERLESRGIAAPQVTLVSVDPERDRGQPLRDYAQFFHPDFRGVTGSPDELQALARQLGVAFFVAEHAPGEKGYDVDHSASVLVVDPGARLVGLFRPPLDAEQIAADLARLIKG